MSKTLTILTLALLPAATLCAQQTTAGRHIAGPAQMKTTGMHDRVTPAATRQQVQPGQHTLSVNPVQLGRGSNIYSITESQQNQVTVDSVLNSVVFIHQQDVTIWGGGSSATGVLRYDVSTDGGATFANDVGPLFPTYTRPARHPQIAFMNAPGNTNPFAANLAVVAPVLDPSPDFDGLVTGRSDVSTSFPTSTENYSFLGMNTLIPGGLCESVPGTFWTTDAEYNGSNYTGNIHFYKGVDNGSDIVWTQAFTGTPSNYTGFDGTPYVIRPSIAFSPDGQTGWMAFLGDLTGGTDSVLHPCLSKSTDGGATWGTPVEVDLNAQAWVADSLQTLWVDSGGNPVSSGRATCAYDFDLAVDAAGNPHFVVVVATADVNSGYALFSGLAKFLADVTSTDGGTTWTTKYISPVLTFRGSFGTPNPVTMDNYPQVSRTADGKMIFYSWLDSDTLMVGFGEFNNVAPNLRIAGLNSVTGEQTYPKLVTDGDLIWEGRAMFPTLSPLMLGNGYTWNLPIVMAEMVINDPDQSTAFWYFGNDATICAANFHNPATMNLAWNPILYTANNYGSCTLDAPENSTTGTNLQEAYPNPASGEVQIGFELASATDISLELVNVFGQKVADLAKGGYAAGKHLVHVDCTAIPAGVYFYNLRAGEQVQSKRMIIVK